MYNGCYGYDNCYPGYFPSGYANCCGGCRGENGFRDYYGCDRGRRRGDFPPEIVFGNGDCRRRENHFDRQNRNNHRCGYIKYREFEQRFEDGANFDSFDSDRRF